MLNIEISVLALVQQFLGIRTRPTLASELYHDLHIYGDDAGELLDDVYKQYSTSFEGFIFNAYFPIETEQMPRFAKLLGFKDKKFGSFTVAHLVEVVRRGHWFEPESVSNPKLGH